MKKRPISVTIAGVLLLLVGSVSMLSMISLLFRPGMLEEIFRAGGSYLSVSISIFAGLLIATCGIFVFRRKNWARWLFLIWSIPSFLIGLVRSHFAPISVSPGVFTLIIGLLLTIGARGWFTTTEKPAPDEKSA